MPTMTRGATMPNTGHGQLPCKHHVQAINTTTSVLTHTWPHHDINNLLFADNDGCESSGGLGQQEQEDAHYVLLFLMTLRLSAETNGGLRPHGGKIN